MKILGLLKGSRKSQLKKTNGKELCLGPNNPDLYTPAHHRIVLLELRRHF